MKLYPVHVLLEGKTALVVGGGPVAAAKAGALLQSGARVRVIAPQCSREMTELIESAETKFPGSDSLKRTKRFAYLKLMEKTQNTDPFKFIIYSSKAGEQTPQINPDDVKETRGAKR